MWSAHGEYWLTQLSVFYNSKNLLSRNFKLSFQNLSNALDIWKRMPMTLWLSSNKERILGAI